MTAIHSEIQELLHRYWGFDALRPHQQDVIDAAMAGEDALIVMPTGGGKSLCFQIPPLLDGGLTLVVSPLIALMKDQVDSLKVIGYPAGALNSSMPSSEVQDVIQKIKSGDLKLLYVSPERLVSPDFLDLMSMANKCQGVSRVAIDEAHCISAWGHDFRPEYRQLGSLKQRFPKAPVHAFTATATPQVQEDIIEQLRLRSPRRVIGDFDRPNLTYRVLPKENSIDVMVNTIGRFPNDGVIIYCVSRKDTERVAHSLTQNGITARAYHAGLDPAERSEISEAFAQERLNVVAATIAFGMGIDRANVRCVIHDSMPRSIEGYQQETGRAGRDGLPSECLMLYSNGDLAKWREVTRRGHSGDQAAHILSKLEEVRRFATGLECRHRFLSQYFGQQYPHEDCGACDMCLDGVRLVQGGTKIGHRILVTVKDLQELSGNYGFGVAHLANVLIGANRKRIRERKHNTVRGFGMLRDHNLVRVTAYIHQMVDQGLLGQSTGEFPAVFLTEAGANCLRERGEVRLRDTAVMEGKPARRRERGIILSENDAGLFERLRELRREIATERGVPAYVVFHDSTLMALASSRPASLEAFCRVPGVGQARGSELGPRFVRAIAEYCQEHGPAEHAPRKPPHTAEFFERGLTLAEISEATGLKTSTLGGHLVAWIAATDPESIEPWVSAELYQEISGVLHLSEDGRLKPIYEALNAVEIRTESPPRVEYDQIRAVITHHRLRPQP